MSDVYSGLPDVNPQPGTPEGPSTLPEQLQEKTREQIYELLSQEHQRESALQKAQHELELEKLKNAPAPPVSQIPQQATVQSPYANGQQPVDLWTDPDKYLDNQMRQRLTPLVQSVANSLQSTNRETFKQNIGAENWDKYGEEIERFIRTLNPATRQDPQAYKAAWDYVRGMHTDDIVEERVSKATKEAVTHVLQELGIAQDRISEITGGNKPPQQQQRQQTSLFQNNIGTATPESGKSRKFTPNIPPRSKLTPEQQRVAKGFGMTDEEYIAYQA